MKAIPKVKSKRLARSTIPKIPKPDGATKETSEQWAEFTEFFTPAIRNVVNFAKNLPGFQLFGQEDQVTLLKVRVLLQLLRGQTDPH